MLFYSRGLFVLEHVEHEKQRDRMLAKEYVIERSRRVNNVTIMRDILCGSSAIPLALKARCVAKKQHSIEHYQCL